MKNSSITNNTSKWLKRIQLIIIVLAFISPAYYFVGYSYYLGMLNTFGISDEQFSLSIESTYAMSYMALVEPIFELIYLPIKNFSFLLTITALIISFFLILLLTLALKNEGYFEKSIDRIKNKITNNNYLISLFVTFLVSISTYLIYSLTLFLCLFWVLPLLIGYSKGEDYAENKIDSFIKNGCAYHDKKMWNDCSSLIDNNGEVLYEGILIASSDKMAAFFLKEGAVIINIPENSRILKKINPEFIWHETP